MGPGAPLELIGAVARRLNGPAEPERALGDVAELVRAGLGARAVSIWLGARPRLRVRAPGDAALAAGADQDLPPGARRVPIVWGGEAYGYLEAEPAGDADAPLLRVVGDVLAPFLASVETSEDLASEVALRSRAVGVERRFTALVIDSLPLGLYVVDRDYRIVVWNRKRETGTQGLRRHDVVGRPVFDVLTRQPPEALRAEFDRVFETGEIQQEELDVAAGQERRVYRISRIPMRLDGDAVTHVITIGEDVTEWRAVQSHLVQHDKLAALGQLAAGVMHEINNPLATIGACVAALEARLGEPGPAAEAAAREYLGIIDKEVQRCGRIADGLLDFSRPKRRTREPLAPAEVLEGTLFLLQHHRRVKRLGVVREFAAETPRILGNAEQLTQVFMALVLNAADAMEHGGTLTVRCGPAPDRDGAVVEVEDTGVGIAREQLPHIFEPFFTTKAPGRGTGLGLSICYGIVRDHGGRIEVESRPGEGSRFRVLLPRQGDGDREGTAA